MPKENIVPIVYQQQLVEEIKELQEASWNKIIRMYGDNYVSERGKEGYGPMDFVSESALMVAKSESIVSRIRRDYPTIAKLFEHNRSGTIAFLKANEALAGYKITHDFIVPFSASGSGWKVWADYKNHIESYVEKLCRKLEDSKGRRFDEPLRKAREVLSKHVHDKYYAKLPRWPDVGKVNEELIYLDTGDCYEYRPYQLVWSCVGWVTVKDERPAYNTYKAEFRGEPAIKLLVIDYDKLKELEGIVSSRSLEDAERMIDERHRTRDRSQLTWETLK